jgi:hypothetical protein
MLIPNESKKINRYKNLHEGKTCCVFATGPSIRKTNFEGLDSFCSFGCNSFYNHWFRTNYFCVTDQIVWENHKRKILDQNIVFKGNLIKQYAEYKSNIINLSLKDQFLVECTKGYGLINKGIYKGHTVVNHILQIVYWMGFKTVFLFGCDCDYSKDYHFDGTQIDNFHRTNWDEVFEQYEVSKYFYELDGREIYNATNGGNLEVFERKHPLKNFLI